MATVVYSNEEDDMCSLVIDGEEYVEDEERAIIPKVVLKQIRVEDIPDNFQIEICESKDSSVIMVSVPMTFIKVGKNEFQVIYDELITRKYWDGPVGLKLYMETKKDVIELYQQAKNAVKSQKNTNPKCRGIGELSLLDFLERAEGKNNNLAEKKFVLAGGGTLECPILTGGGYGADISYQGTKVLTYLGDGYGWGCERTPAERAKEKEFYGIYFNEYHAQKNSQSSELESYRTIVCTRIPVVIIHIRCLLRYANQK